MCKALNKRTATREQLKNSVYVGRPSKFGNPFVLRNEEERTAVIEKYRSWIIRQPLLIQAAKKELRGKNLVCWCSPRACHADVLIEIANS